MKPIIELEEGMWVKYVDRETNNVRIGKVFRGVEDSPLSEENMLIKREDGSVRKITTERILKVYPRIKIKMNPSERSL